VPSTYSKSESRINFKFGGDTTIETSNLRLKGPRWNRDGIWKLEKLDFAIKIGKRSKITTQLLYRQPIYKVAYGLSFGTID